MVGIAVEEFPDEDGAAVFADKDTFTVWDNVEGVEMSESVFPLVDWEVFSVTEGEKGGGWLVAAVVVVVDAPILVDWVDDVYVAGDSDGGRVSDSGCDLRLNNECGSGTTRGSADWLS